MCILCTHQNMHAYELAAIGNLLCGGNDSGCGGSHGECLRKNQYGEIKWNYDAYACMSVSTTHHTNHTEAPSSSPATVTKPITHYFMESCAKLHRRICFARIYAMYRSAYYVWYSVWVPMCVYANYKVLPFQLYYPMVSQFSKLMQCD